MHMFPAWLENRDDSSMKSITQTAQAQLIHDERTCLLSRAAAGLHGRCHVCDLTPHRRLITPVLAPGPTAVGCGLFLAGP